MNKWNIQSKRGSQNIKAVAAKKKRSFFSLALMMAMIAVLFALFLSDMGKALGGRVCQLPFIRDVCANKHCKLAGTYLILALGRVKEALLYIKSMILSLINQVPVLSNIVKTIEKHWMLVYAWVKIHICDRLCSIFSCGKSLAKNVSQRVQTGRG